jgi:cobalt/nickel transport system permease protein
MTHMHIPDGVLPVWLWVLGFFIMSLIMGFSLYRLRSMDMKMKIPLLGTLSAAMLVAMSLEIVPLAYHINLTVVTGILLGPALGFVAAFIANVMLALIGHGGITVLGLNTLLLGAEAVLGHAFFSLLGSRLPLFWRAAAATVITLLCTTGLLIGIVAVSNANPAAFMESHGHEEGGHEGPISTGRFAAMALGLGALGWIIEAAITGSVVRFIAKVKPDLLRHVLHANTTPRKERETP